MDGYARHVKAEIPPEQVAELEAVDLLAARLRAHIASTSTDIATLHVHGAKSKAIQDHSASRSSPIEDRSVASVPDGRLWNACPYHRTLWDGLLLKRPPRAPRSPKNRRQPAARRERPYAAPVALAAGGAMAPAAHPYLRLVNRTSPLGSRSAAKPGS
jgi:hypothetical protein